MAGTQIGACEQVIGQSEKPPFIMGSNGPTVLHIGYLPATVEEVFFPHAEVVGDVGPSLALLADRLEGKLANAGALLPLIERPFYTCIKFGRFYFAYHTAR